jgi:uncharacterized membrane protein YhdT
MVMETRDMLAYATIACFVWWAVMTVVVISAQLFYPQNMSGKMSFSNWRHLALMSIPLFWVAMWCFRFMFEGPLF